MPACHQRFELTFAWTGGCYLFIELALGVVRIVRHKVEPLAEFAHYERRCRAGSQLPTGPWLSASFATRTPGQGVRTGALLDRADPVALEMRPLNL